MTQRQSRLRGVHRLHAVLTFLVVLTLLVLNRTGVLSGGVALSVFLMIEVPLLVVLLVLTVLRFRRRSHSSSADEGGLLARLEAEEPLLRPAVAELRAFGSLALALTGKRHVPHGARPFGYTRGTMAIPGVLIALSLVELVIVHVLVPWTWLRVALLVLSVWGVLFLLGFVATRVVHPHVVTDDGLLLRWGHRTVLSTPLTNIASVARYANHAHTQPQVEGERLILTQAKSTNVLVRFVEPVEAEAPVPAKASPADFRAREVHLYVDDPDGFLQAFQPLTDGTTV